MKAVFTSSPRPVVAKRAPVTVRATLPFGPRSHEGMHAAIMKPSCKGWILSRSGFGVMKDFKPVRSLIAQSSTGGGSGGSGNNSGGNGGDGKGDEPEEDRFLDEDEASKFAAAKGFKLPADFIEAAQTGGIRLSILEAYATIMSSSAFTVAVCNLFPFIRDRLLSDPRFLFKLGAEIAIDTVCASIAEVRKRGDKFWDEFTFYVSDIVVGVVLDGALVTLIAPVAILGAAGRIIKTPGVIGSLQRLSASLPAAMFERSPAGLKPYSVGQRLGGFAIKGLEYSLAGIACGLVGQSLANGLIMAQRAIGGGADVHEDLPPIFKTSLVWGLFMGVSSNSRYQVVVGLERLLEALPIVKKIPQLADAGTVAIRFTNNVIGGENFIDIARWAGVQ